MNSRLAEFIKYERAYGDPNYHMGPARMSDAVNDLRSIPCRGAYLDVSCGRGEMLRHAEALGFSPVQGTEIVGDLIDGDRVVRAEAHALPFPDRSFDVVTMFDVMEHLVIGDDEAACRELARVAGKHILLTVNNRPSIHGGIDLHINKRPYPEWDRLFHQWFPGRVSRIEGQRSFASEACRIDLTI